MRESHALDVPDWRKIAKVFVEGDAQTKGSMRALLTKDGRPFVTHQNPGKLGAWQGKIAHAVSTATGRPVPTALPVAVSLTFTFRRPLDHFYHRKSGDVLRDDAPLFVPALKDGDKLERAVWDALTEVLYIDDRQVVVWKGRKVYVGAPDAADRAGVMIEAWELQR